MLRDSKLSHSDMLLGPSQHEGSARQLTDAPFLANATSAIVLLSREKEKKMTMATTELTITGHEAAQIERANASSATPVVFVHGLWLLPSSWDRWVTLFEEAGYAGITPGWPDDPETVTQAREHPEVLAGKGIAQIADYEE